MTSIDQKNSGTSAVETRSYNSTNELTSRTFAAQSAVNWINDSFTDNDTVEYATADLDNDGNVDDGTWSASSGQLQNDTVIAVSGAPASGNGSILLVERGDHQTFRISADIELSGSADNGGLVFGYEDYQNYWVYMANRSAGRYELYQVASGAWTLKIWGGSVAGGGGTFALTADVKSGSVSQTGQFVAGIDATVAPGQVGIWAGSGSSAVKADNFKVRALNADLAIDGRFSDDVGPCSISGNQYVMNSSGDTRQSVLHSVRIGGEYVVQADVTHRTNVPAGIIVNYQDPENFGVVKLINVGATTGFIQYSEFEDGKTEAGRALGTNFTIADNTAYTLKASVTESGGNQTLEVFVNGTSRLSTGTIDDTWSAGYVGLWRAKTDLGGSPVTHDQIFDNFKVGVDQNADDDVDDASDHVFVNYDFGGSWTTMDLAYDDNGNLTDDGLYQYEYDAWNRLVATFYPEGDKTDSGQSIGSYEYDGKNRRLVKIVTNRGEGDWNTDADQEIRYFYSDQWQIVEVRNGSNQAKQQWVYGTQYADEIILMDNNGPSDTDDDCDPDNTLMAEIFIPADQRYFYHQDRNWNVVALTTITDGSQYVNGDVVEYILVGQLFAHLTSITASNGITSHKTLVSVPEIEFELGSARLAKWGGQKAREFDRTDQIADRRNYGDLQNSIVPVRRTRNEIYDLGPPAPPGPFNGELPESEGVCCSESIDTETTQNVDGWSQADAESEFLARVSSDVYSALETVCDGCCTHIGCAPCGYSYEITSLRCSPWVSSLRYVCTARILMTWGCGYLIR